MWQFKYGQAALDIAFWVLYSVWLVVELAIFIYYY